MPRIPRVEIKDALYYVTSRGDNDQNIFKDEEDYQVYTSLLKKYKEQYGFKLFSYMLLPKYLHLLIEFTKEVMISEVMHDLNSSYIKYFNGKYERKGHLFQERFKLTLIEKESYLLYISAHIHYGPCRLNLCKEPAEYEYSSYPSYMQTASSIDLSEEVKEILDLINSQMPAEGGLLKYKDFLGRVSREELIVLGKELHKGGTVGTEEFKRKVKESIIRYKKQAKSGGQKNRKKTVLTAVLVITVLIIANIIFFGRSRHLKKEFQILSENKEREITEKVEKTKQKIRKGMQEQFGADMVSYRVMARRLELEKKKNEELKSQKIGKEDD